MNFTQRIKNIDHKKFKNKPLIIILIGFVFSFLLYIFSPEPTKAPSKTKLPNAIVKDIYFTNKPIPVIGTGPVYPKTKINITTQVSGKVVELHKNMVTGGLITKNSVLIKIDPRPYQAMLTQSISQENALSAELKFVEKQLVRDNKLSKTGSASEMKRQETESRRDKLKAQIESAKAQSTSKKLDLEYTEILAPFNGRVLNEQIDEGAVVQKGANVAEIYAEDFFEIIVALSDYNASLIPGLWDKKIGKKINSKVIIPYRGNLYEWPGYLDRVEAGVDSETKTIDVIINIPNPTLPGKLINNDESNVFIDPPSLLPGVYTRVEIKGIEIPYALIPQKALRENNKIWIINSDKKIKVISVNVIQELNNFVAITSVPKNDKITLVVNKLNSISDGMEVNIIREKDITK